MKKQPNPELIDEENPELDAEFFARAKPAREMLPPGLVALMPKGRGPQKTPTKKLVAIRLSPEVIEHYRGTGRGWQTRIDETLRASLPKRAKL